MAWMYYLSISNLFIVCSKKYQLMDLMIDNSKNRTSNPRDSTLHQQQTVTVKVRDHLPALGMRASCDELMDYIESLPYESVTVDFDTFTIASRSFVHQYLLRKERSRKMISEINLHPVIARMLETVKKQMEEPRLLR